MGNKQWAMGRETNLLKRRELVLPGRVVDVQDVVIGVLQLVKLSQERLGDVHHRALALERRGAAEGGQGLGKKKTILV